MFTFFDFSFNVILIVLKPEKKKLFLSKYHIIPKLILKPGNGFYKYDLKIITQL